MSWWSGNEGGAFSMLNPQQTFNMLRDSINNAASIQEGAVQKAADIATATAEKNIKYLEGQASIARADLAPFVNAGRAGVDELKNMLGLNGADAQNAAVQKTLSSPQVMQEIEMGTNTFIRSAVAKGYMNSGRAAQELFDVGRNTAANAVDRRNTGLAALANIGGNAAGASANVAMQQGELVARQNTYAGDANSNAALSIGNIQSNAVLNSAQLEVQSRNPYAFMNAGNFNTGGQYGMQGQAYGGTNGKMNDLFSGTSSYANQTGQRQWDPNGAVGGGGGGQMAKVLGGMT